MSKELTTIIMESLNDIIEEEEQALKSVVRRGAGAFEERTFEKIEVFLREATLRKKALDIFAGLRTQWKELSELGACLREWLEGADEVDLINEDITMAYCTADLRLKITTDTLMGIVQQAGVRAFETMKFEQVEEIAVHAIKLQNFQLLVEEACSNIRRRDCVSKQQAVRTHTAA